MRTHPLIQPSFLMVLVAASFVVASSGCGTDANTAGVTPPATYLDGASGDAAAVDGTNGDAATGTADTDPSNLNDALSLADVGAASDSGNGNEVDADPEDTGFQFDPPDSGEEDIAVAPVPGNLFAHTKDKLYTLDNDTLKMVEVGLFTFDKKKGLVTDIALDQFRNLWAITFTDLFDCDADTAKCKWVAKLPKEFNGLTFIPETLVPGSKQEALIGISESGDWNWIKPDGKGSVTMKKLGSYGGGWLSSGDAFSVVGIGTFATVKKKSGGIDTLASIDPKTGKIVKTIGSTGAKGLFGFAWAANSFYGFSSDGSIYVIDVNTGKATKSTQIVTPKGAKWWGAGVSTRANGP